MRDVRVLFIEDDSVDRMAFKRAVREEGLPYDCQMAISFLEAKGALEAGPFDIVISDYNLGDGNAFDILDLKPDCPVIVVTGAGSEEIAVRAMKAGAYDYIIKDPELNYLKVLPLTVDKAVKQAKTERKCRIMSQRESEDASVFEGGGLRETLNLINLAASSGSPVLITGETGTGKTLAAKAIHYRGESPNSPFVSVNCSALPETLIEAELFGNEKGAFTGAMASRKGLFEMAEGGTLFLDEIGEMPMHLQAKLLSVIEDKKLRRLGGESERPVDVRVIAATGVDLDSAVGKTFRSDLYYRLSVVRIHVPPLRERKEDIPELCRWLLKKLSDGKDVSVPDHEVEKLTLYDWPGNVRDLKNTLERALILQKGPVLRPSELLPTGKKATTEPIGAEDCATGNCTVDKLIPLEELEKRHIKLALDKLAGNLTKTANVLGIGLSTLKRKVKTYNLA